MRIALLSVCFFVITQQTHAAAKAKQKKPAIVAVDPFENESLEHKSNYLLDLMEKAFDSNENLSVSMVKKPPKKAPPKTNKASRDKTQPAKKKPKQGKKLVKVGPRKYFNILKTLPKFLNANIESRIENDEKASKQSIEQGNEETQNAIQSRILVGGSVEDETMEQESKEGRRAEKQRRFEDTYRYENEPLSKMLLWLIMSSQNPSIKNALEASKTAVDKYVKHTVDKAGAQAALRYTDYSSLRFDKDRIMVYCGGQMYVYHTLKDSKICFNGQIYEVRLI